MPKSSTKAVLPIVEFPGQAALGALVIPASSSTRHHVDQLKSGVLALQRCTGCGRYRHPIAPVCPYCRATTSEWSACEGRGVAVSWVRYPRSYLPEFEKLVPYVVLCVELAEGARMFGRLVDPDVEPSIGMPVRVVIERWSDGGHAPAFAFDSGNA